MSRTFGTLVIVCCVALLYSCNTVKLHKIALYSKTDSVAVNHYDSGNVSSRTVHSASTVDSAVKSSVSSFTGQGVTVNFDTAGSAGFVDGPITIEQQEGKTIVSAPGRKIKSITAHNNSATQTSNTVELYKADTLNITDRKSVV